MKSCISRAAADAVKRYSIVEDPVPNSLLPTDARRLNVSGGIDFGLKVPSIGMGFGGEIVGTRTQGYQSQSTGEVTSASRIDVGVQVYKDIGGVRGTLYGGYSNEFVKQQTVGKDPGKFILRIGVAF
jgi:hypothetical protein